MNLCNLPSNYCLWQLLLPHGVLMVYLWPIRRLYGSFMACWKAVWFTLWTISRTYGQLGALFRRQPRRYLGKEFHMYFCILLFYFYVFLLYFMALLKLIMEAIYRWFYFQVL